MNTDIRIKTTFPTHHKTIRLKKKLGTEGIFSLIALWLYVAQYRPNGDISDLTVEDISAVSLWEKEPSHFLNTLIEVGFIDEYLNPDGSITRKIHDWEEHNPYASQSQKRSALARIKALKRWGKLNEASLLRHEDPNIRSIVAQLLAQRKHKKQPTHTQKNTNADSIASKKRQKSYPHADPNACPENLYTQDFHANCNAISNATCNAIGNAPIPTPNPTPNPSPKKIYFDYVLLSDEEYKKLTDVLGDKTDDYIQRLNDYIHQIGYKKASSKYKSHYHVILNWYRKDKKEIEQKIMVLETIRKNNYL